MDSKENEISQSTLYNIHQHQLINGKTNDNKQKEIVNIFGGIDDVISIVLESNHNLNQLQINKLHSIIIDANNQQRTKIVNKPSANDENKNYNKIVTYEFSDEHIIMSKLFQERLVNKLLYIIHSKLIMCLLLLMLNIELLLYLYFTINVTYIYGTTMWIIIILYILLWVLYANKHAMKLLLKEFVFLFKVYYLIILIVTIIWLEYLNLNDPKRMYYHMSLMLALGLLLFLVLIFDAINVSQTNKILISTVTIGLFSMRTLYLLQRKYYPDLSQDNMQYITKQQITINDYFGFGDIKMSLLSVASNSATILTIFLFQQVIKTVFYPTQSLVIKCKAFIKYENNKQKTPTTKHLKLWRSVCIGCTCFALVYTTMRVVIKNRINALFTIDMVNILALIIFLCLLIKNNIKRITTTAIGWFILCIIDGVAALILRFDPPSTSGTFVLFGLFSAYLLKMKKYNKCNTPNNSNNSSVNNSNNENRSTKLCIPLNVDEDNAITEAPNEIEIRNVKKGNKWNNIDRTESISSVILNRTESTAL